MYPLNPNAISVTEADSDTSNEASSSSLADSGEVVVMHPPMVSLMHQPI